jgi:hypothetical protein
MNILIIFKPQNRFAGKQYNFNICRIKETVVKMDLENP